MDKNAKVRLMGDVLRIDLRCGDAASVTVATACTTAEIAIIKIIQGVSTIGFPDGTTLARKRCGVTECDAVMAALRGLGWNVVDEDEEPPTGSPEIEAVLCDSGEQALDPEPGVCLDSVVDRAGDMLDGACLTNVVVVKAGGKFYVGEFVFEFREVDEAEAGRVAKAFNDEEG